AASCSSGQDSERPARRTAAGSGLPSRGCCPGAGRTPGGVSRPGQRRPWPAGRTGRAERAQTITGSAPPAIRRDALVGDPHALRGRTGLPEHIDRYAAARIPVAADPEPARLEQLHEPLGDGERAVLVEGAVIAEGSEIEL